MTEIALRTYNQEIKDLIDHGHFDEAIAHCQHILETFPRHIETYRLLGKAFLEQGRHGDAADVFQRVLSAIPEDWLSHVAMAIVREDESNLDMAIWHMERAYEVNPSNPTVQQEVRRLRGRRDGVEPPKLRLTRSALARMYIKGGLYGQAIAEIRSALAEDPDRPDLQILLASALFDSGSAQEAADICTTVLQKLPYCLEANRVLGMALLASNKQADADKLFQRIESLDPHIDLDILKKEKRIAEHPGQTVSLSRLEYEGQEKTVRTKQPSWASSLGLKIEEPQKGPAIPDWLSSTSQQPSAIPPAVKPSAPAAPAAEVPSWLNEAAAAVNYSGAGGSVFGAPAAPAPIAASEPIARNATGELPDWIQAQSQPAETPAVERPSGPLPDWLSAATMPPPPPPTTESPTTGSTLPDWIKTSSLPPEKPKETISDIPDWLAAPTPPSVEALPSTSLPEWTRPETKTSPLGVEPNNIPDWLNSSQPATPEIGPEQEWMKQTPAAAPGADAVPDWMRGADATEPPPAAAQPAESMPDWLRDNAPPAAKPVELVPEWMRTVAPLSESLPASPIATGAPVEDLPEWMKPDLNEAPISFPSSEPVLGGKIRTSPLAAQPPIAASAPSATPEAAVPDWMAGISTGPSAPVAPVIPAEDAIPDWMKPAETGSAAPAAQPVESIAEATVPDWMKPPPQAAAQPSAPKPDAGIPDWLNAPSQPAPAATLSAPVEEVEPQEAEAIPEIEMPDWLKAVPAPAPERAPSPATPSAANMESPAEPAAMGDLPEWLKGGSITMPAVPDRIAEPIPAVPEMQKPDLGFSVDQAADSPISEPGPAQVTPTSSDGIDLPEWLVSQLQGKPKESSASAPAASPIPGPLPDWLKPASSGATPAPVVDWEKAASQPVPPAPVDATRPATGLSSDKPSGGVSETPGVLKPTGSDTVARWLDRRLKTSTLSSLDESALKAGVKPSTPPTTGRPGTGSTQLPTWLDSQKPGGSDTVVRWMDKRETGSLRKVTASFSSVSKSPVPPAAPVEQPAPAPEIAAVIPPASPPVVSGTEDTVTSKKAPAPVPVQPAPVQPKPVFPAREPAPVQRPPDAEITRPPIAVATPAAPAPAAEDEDEGAFVPPPEWLQKALGSAVSEVPPIPKKQTGGLRPGTVTPVIPQAQPVPVAPLRVDPPTVMPAAPVPVASPAPATRQETIPVEEPPPAAAAPSGAWVPLTPAPPAKVEKPVKKPARKKSRKLTGVEAEALIREARIYLESDLQKASDAYQMVIDDPPSAEVVAGDLTTYLEQDPSSPQMWNLLGDACSRAGRLQDAYRAYAEALRRM
jgi:tetratricopeptide (TPR) repeat protein